MNTRKILQTIGLMAIAVISSCTSNKSDIILEAPEDGAMFFTGYDVHFVAEIMDELGVKSYSIKIADKRGKTDRREGAMPFRYNRTWELHNEKEVHLHHHEIIIPGRAAPGDYRFTISCINGAGNKSKVSQNIRIVNPR